MCSYDERTGGGVTPEGEKRVKGIIQWVEAGTSVECSIMQYDRLFNKPSPGSDTGDFLDDINPDSVTVLEGARCEPSVAMDCLGHMSAVEGGATHHGELHYQFERQGYYALDSSSTKDKLVFNRVVTLRDTWGGEAKAVDGATAVEEGGERSGAERRCRRPTMQSAGYFFVFSLR